MELDERKIIARRAAFELPLNGAINLGVGAPDGVASVAAEEQVTPFLTMTTEAGAIGGVLAGGSSFGSSANADCDHRPEPDVRFLPRRRLGPHLPRHGGGRRERQRQHQQVRRQAQRLRRLHRHLAELARGRLRRHLHGGRARDRDRGRQAQNRQGGQGAQVCRAVEQITFSGTTPLRNRSPLST